MRREPPSHTVQLNSVGAVIQASDDAATKGSFCDVDFIMGTADSNECISPPTGQDNYTIIEAEDACMEAGRLAHATTTASSFHLSYEWEGMHPKGCFKASCSAAANGICYFYNAKDPVTTPVAGQPVCTRVKYLNGTTYNAAAPADDLGCPDGYEGVHNDDDCEVFATCKSYGKIDADFNIGSNDPTQTQLYPPGCFISITDGNVYYNNKTTQAAVGTPTSVSGIPICVVSATVSWPKPWGPLLANPSPAAAPASAE